MRIVYQGMMRIAALAATCAALTLPAAAKGKIPTPKISSKQAAAAALAKYPNGKLHGKTHLEQEDGRWQYEVFVQNGKKLLEVNVDANTGKVVDVEETNAAEEAKEKKAKGHQKESDEKGEKGEKPEKR